MGILIYGFCFLGMWFYLDDTEKTMGGLAKFFLGIAWPMLLMASIMAALSVYIEGRKDKNGKA